jgi:hypothetical protein
VRSKTSSLSHSRKGSDQSEDSIALTKQDSVAQAKQNVQRASVYSIGDDDRDPWSPAVARTANVQRMIVVKGRMSPAPKGEGWV